MFRDSAVCLASAFIDARGHRELSGTLEGEPGREPVMEQIRAWLDAKNR